MLSITLLCLSKSKLAFKVKLRCYLFSGCIFFFTLQICQSKNSSPFFHLPEVNIQTLSPCIQHSPTSSFWSHLYKLLYALDLQTQWLTFWFSVLPRIFSFLDFVSVLSFARYDLPFSQPEKFLHILQEPLQTSPSLWNLPDLSQVKHSTPEQFESKYPKHVSHCVVNLYLYVCVLYLMWAYCYTVPGRILFI